MGKIVEIVRNSGRTLASMLKIAVMSRGASVASKEGKGKELIILGNGPSLRHTIDRNIEILLSHPLMCLNFAAISPEFRRLRPQYYILADPLFFNSLSHNSNVRKLWEELSRVSWDMTLLIPSKFKHLAAPLLMNCKNIKLRYFNLTPIEGFKGVSHFLYSLGLGMPRPRNVLIPAIMESIRLGYSKIYLCGADHTWTKTLDVDNENFVISIQPHFYEDNEEEHKRVRETYKDLRLHDVLGSMTIAFRSYWHISDYAKTKGVDIINATPGSMIDAFKRGSLS
ncbi:MAG: hypothetical protein J1F38_02995 [Muribaculaceae bacterium]|nr:hypothetical protein [Muribaculaceae bacterium]